MTHQLIPGDLGDIPQSTVLTCVEMILRAEINNSCVKVWCSGRRGDAVLWVTSWWGWSPWSCYRGSWSLFHALCSIARQGQGGCHESLTVSDSVCLSESRTKRTNWHGPKQHMDRLYNEDIGQKRHKRIISNIPSSSVSLSPLLLYKNRHVRGHYSPFIGYERVELYQTSSQFLWWQS